MKRRAYVMNAGCSVGGGVNGSGASAGGVSGGSVSSSCCGSSSSSGSGIGSCGGGGVGGSGGGVSGGVSRPGSAASKRSLESGSCVRGVCSIFDRSNELRIYVLVFVIACACYVNGLAGDFVHDDIPAITINKDVLGTSPIWSVFKNDFWGTPMADVNSHKSYRPLTIISFRLNRFLFGLRPFWFHATNVLLHAAVCILFTRVCISVAGLRKSFATIAGILFAIHPIHTEAVTGIVGRADVLACIFFLISLLAYHGKPESPDNTAVWLSIVLGGVSMLAKETGITVFLLNLTYDLYRCWPALKRTIVDARWTEETQQFWRRVSKMLLSMGLLLAMRLALLQGSFPKFSQQDNPAAFHPNLYVRILTFCYLAAFNWWLVLCPSTISHDWQMGSIPVLTSVGDPRNLLTLGAFVAALLLLYRGIMDFEVQRHIPLVLGFLLLFVPFLPATNLLVTVGFVVAERVLYIPSMGSVLLVVYGAQLAWEAAPRYRGLITFMGILLITTGSCKTISRNRDWCSRETLLRAGLAVLPHNAKMHYNFGNFLRDSSKPDLATVHYKEALRLWPSYASAHNNLGTLMNVAEKAEWHFQTAIRYSSEHVNAHYNLGQLYRKNNRTAEASRMFERCIALESTFTPAYLELIKLRKGIVSGRLLREVVRLNPSDQDRLAQYGFWLLDNEFVLDALYQFQSSLRIQEMHTLSFIGICRTLRKLGQTSRLLQVISRWQLMIRITNGGMSRQTDVYLRDWSIKNELRNRAMVYDYDTVSITEEPQPTASRSCTGTAAAATISPIQSVHPHHTTNIRRIGIGDEPNCNVSAESLQTARPVKNSGNTACTAATVAAQGKDNKSCNKMCRSKRWTKSRHKYSGPPSIDHDQSVAPLFISNILDKL